MQTKHTILLPFLIALGLLAAACDGNLSVTFNEESTGNGDLVTTTYDLADFDSIDVSGAFDVEVTVGATPYIDVVTDEDLVEHLDIRVDDGELRIGLKRGVSVRATEMLATVRVPELRALDVSGASSVNVAGAFGPNQLFDVSGASDVSVEGTGTAVGFDVSGASSLDLALEDVVLAEADLSGASTVVLASAAEVQGDLSGASTLTVPEDALVQVDLSGASNVERN